MSLDPKLAEILFDFFSRISYTMQPKNLAGVPGSKKPLSHNDMKRLQAALKAASPEYAEWLEKGRPEEQEAKRREELMRKARREAKRRQAHVLAGIDEELALLRKRFGKEADFRLEGQSLHRQHERIIRETAERILAEWEAKGGPEEG